MAGYLPAISISVFMCLLSGGSVEDGIGFLGEN